MACSTYTVLFEGHSLARAFVSPHPTDTGQVGSVMPIERSGRWEDNTLEINFRDLQSASFPSDMPDVDVVNALLAGAGIEPWKCVVVKNS